MADLGTNLKNFWMKSMEAIGNTATSIANNTRYKVDEMNTVNRRAEILADFGNKAYALWQKGEVFPPSLEEQLKELKRLDERLNDLRAERLAGVKTNIEEEHPAEGQGEAVPMLNVQEEAGDPAEAEQPAPDSAPVIPVENAGEEAASRGQPLSDTISQLFDQIPSARQANDQVSGALDSLENGLQQVSDDLGRGLDELTERVSGQATDEKKAGEDSSADQG